MDAEIIGPDGTSAMHFRHIWISAGERWLATPVLLAPGGAVGIRARLRLVSVGKRGNANGVVQNMPEFQKAFGCKAGQPMVRANACRVW